MSTQVKAYRGLAMEGPIADWYARNTGRDMGRFSQAARVVLEWVPRGARVLEVAPGPGYLALELARLGYQVVGLDISRSFVRIATDNAAKAGVSATFKEGDAAHMPLPDASFDFAISMAAFKNFTDPVGALDEIHRILRPGGGASIQDLRKDASWSAIDQEVARMNLSRASAFLTRWTFRLMLLRRAYTRGELARMAAASRFGGGEITEHGIGFELRLRKAAAAQPEGKQP
jgi:ubiquinone/menaquinone biosynthesis C-methylase UbiE